MKEILVRAEVLHLFDISINQHTNTMLQRSCPSCHGRSNARWRWQTASLHILWWEES